MRVGLSERAGERKTIVVEVEREKENAGERERERDKMGARDRGIEKGPVRKGCAGARQVERAGDYRAAVSRGDGDTPGLTSPRATAVPWRAGRPLPRHLLMAERMLH